MNSLEPGVQYTVLKHLYVWMFGAKMKCIACIGADIFKVVWFHFLRKTRNIRKHVFFATKLDSILKFRFFPTRLTQVESAATLILSFVFLMETWHALELGYWWFGDHCWPIKYRCVGLYFIFIHRWKGYTKWKILTRGWDILHVRVLSYTSLCRFFHYFREKLDQNIFLFKKPTLYLDLLIFWQILTYCFLKLEKVDVFAQKK